MTLNMAIAMADLIKKPFQLNPCLGGAAGLRSTFLSIRKPIKKRGRPQGVVTARRGTQDRAEDRVLVRYSMPIARCRRYSAMSASKRASSRLVMASTRRVDQRASHVIIFADTLRRLRLGCRQRCSFPS